MSDAEIIAQLLEPQPVTGSERNVWAFWNRGLSNCPGLVPTERCQLGSPTRTIMDRPRAGLCRRIPGPHLEVRRRLILP